MKHSQLVKWVLGAGGIVSLSLVFQTVKASPQFEEAVAANNSSDEQTDEKDEDQTDSQDAVYNEWQSQAGHQNLSAGKYATASASSAVMVGTANQANQSKAKSVPNLKPAVAKQGTPAKKKKTKHTTQSNSVAVQYPGKPADIDMVITASGQVQKVTEPKPKTTASVSKPAVKKSTAVVASSTGTAKSSSTAVVTPAPPKVETPPPSVEVSQPQVPDTSVTQDTSNDQPTTTSKPKKKHTKTRKS